MCLLLTTLFASLLVVASLTQRLPVGLRPKKILPAAMRNDVIDYSSRNPSTAVVIAMSTVRMLSQVPTPGSSPTMIVEPLRCTGSTAVVCSCRTAATTACSSSFVWHVRNTPELDRSALLPKPLRRPCGRIQRRLQRPHPLAVAESTAVVGLV